MSQLSDGTDKLLILRGFACFMVFFSHATPPVLSIFGVDSSFIFFQDGSSAVKIFFILSGYLIAKNFFNGKYTFDPRGITNFYKSRLLRILPVYYFVSLILIILFYQSLFFSKEGLLKLLSVFSFGFEIDQKPYFSSAFWTLSVEMQFYFVAPFILYLLIKIINTSTNKIRWDIFVLLLVSGLCLRLFKQSYEDVFEISQIKMFISSMYFFILGILTNLLAPVFKKYFYKLKFINLIFYSSFFLVSIFLSFNVFLVTRYGQAMMPQGISLSLFIGLSSMFWICLAELNSTRCVELDWKKIWIKPTHILEAFGLISFSFYLWHGDVLSNLRKIFGSDAWISYTSSTLLSFAITIVLSFASYYLIEKGALWRWFTKSFEPA